MDIQLVVALQTILGKNMELLIVLGATSKVEPPSATTYTIMLDNPQLVPLLDLGNKEWCSNESDVILKINIIEDNEVTPLGTNTTVFYVFPPLECVICIQSSKEELENPDVVAEAPKEISPPTIVPNVHVCQVSDVPTMMLPSRKTNLPTTTSYVEKLWESLNVGKSTLGILVCKESG